MDLHIKKQQQQNPQTNIFVRFIFILNDSMKIKYIRFMLSFGILDSWQYIKSPIESIKFRLLKYCMHDFPFDLYIIQFHKNKNK